MMEQDSYEYDEGYRSSYKYYLKGNCNLILSAPHGGNLVPDDVPDRTNQKYLQAVSSYGISANGCSRTISIVKDSRTDEFTENVANTLNQLFNIKPYVIIARWHRKKVDFNRDLLEATLNDPEATIAYKNYHSTLDKTIDQVNQIFGSALLIDIHGHSQGNYSMIGYMLSKDQLSEENLSSKAFHTSISSIAKSNLEECIRGQTAFGSLLEKHGLGVIYPSINHRKPKLQTFYSGGYITKHYSNKINTIQTELSNDIRIGPNRINNATNFAHALIEYMRLHNLLRTISRK